MSATWGNKFRVTIFGESHGECIGAVIDGLPSGFEIDMDKIYLEMERRAPGKNDISTPRRESDKPEIISGLFNRKTTGAPLTIQIKNNDTRSKDYSKIKDIMRPGHADYSAYNRYDGYNDYRGSGHFSGRITAPIVFAGALAKQILEKKGIHIGSHIYSVSEIKDDIFDLEYLCSGDVCLKFDNFRGKSLPLINESLENKIVEYVKYSREKGDSIGGVIECAIVGVDVGVGNPFF